MSIIEEIKSRLNIVDIASGYLKLERAGGNFKARCPFHNEKTPSFFISPARQSYHCFGCNRGGDLISFVEEVEGLDFSGALKVLAARAGIELTRETQTRKTENREREEIYRALELATKFYEAVLPKFPIATSYLAERGLTEDTIKHFRVGFAPDEWRALGDFLVKKGVSEPTMERAGLIVRSKGFTPSSSRGFYDRFRSRVMFPISDSSGRVIAFSGRVLAEGKGKTLGESAQAKYVNSPETEVFHKSRALFGFFQAREEMRRGDGAVLVEGQVDLVLAHQSGTKNTVASSGTALTADHLALIKRFTSNLVLALDADTAGRSATHRAIELALGHDMQVRIARLPEGMDPAELIRKDPALWHEAVRGAKQVIDFYLELLPELNPKQDLLRAAVSEIIIPFIPHLRSTLDQAHFVGRVAQLLSMKEEPVWEEVKRRGATQAIDQKAGELLRVADTLSRRARIARIIMGIIFWQEESEHPIVAECAPYRSRLSALLSEELRALPQITPSSRSHIPTTFHFSSIKNHSPYPDTAHNFLNQKNEILQKSEIESKEVICGRALTVYDHDRDKLIFEAEARFHGSERLREEIEELLKNLEEEIIRDRFAEKMKELKEAEQGNDIKRAGDILKECQELSKKLQGFKL